MDLKAAAIARFAEPVKAFIIEDIAVGVVKAKLEEFVKDSSNPYDDALMGMLWPLMEKALRDAADKLSEGVSA